MFIVFEERGIVNVPLISTVKSSLIQRSPSIGAKKNLSNDYEHHVKHPTPPTSHPTSESATITNRLFGFKPLELGEQVYRSGADDRWRS